MNDKAKNPTESADTSRDFEFLARDGFLSDEMPKVIEHFRQKHRRWFDLYDELNEFAVSLIPQMHIDATSPQSVWGSAIFERLVSTGQAAIVLMERGMAAQARMLARCFLEAVFILRAITADPEFAVEYERSHQKDRSRCLDRIKKLQLMPNDDPRIVDGAAEVQSFIEKYGIQKRVTELIAKRGQMYPTYLSAYTMLSDAIHSSPRDVGGDAVLQDEDGDFRGMKWRPSDHGFEALFVLIGEELLIALECIEMLFSLPTANFIKHKTAILSALAESKDSPSSD